MDQGTATFSAESIVVALITTRIANDSRQKSSVYEIAIFWLIGTRQIEDRKFEDVEATTIFVLFIVFTLLSIFLRKRLNRAQANL